MRFTRQSFSTALKWDPQFCHNEFHPVLSIALWPRRAVHPMTGFHRASDDQLKHDSEWARKQKSNRSEIHPPEAGPMREPVRIPAAANRLNSNHPMNAKFIKKRIFRT